MTNPNMLDDPLKPLRGQEPFEADNGRVRSTVRDWHIAIAVHPSWAPVLAAALNRALSADEQIARLREERDALAAWKESAISVTPPMQEIGSALGVALGASIHDKILPGIIALQARVRVLEALNARCLEVYGDLPHSIQRLLRRPTREELLALAEAIREADRPEPNATDESLFTRQAAPGDEGGQRG